MRTPITIALSLLAAAAQAAQTDKADQPPAQSLPPATPAVSALLERARLWDSRDRPQLARETLDKLLRVAPEHPEALAVLAQVEARANRPAMTRAALDRLRRVVPDHPSIPGVEMQLRLAGPDKQKLEQIRQMAKQSRLDGHRDMRPKALAAYRALFAGVPPEGDIAFEYWLFVAEDWDAWSEAQTGLSGLAEKHPNNLRYRYALAEHETTKLPMNRTALQILIDMTKLPEYERQARAAWRRAMLRLDPTTENIQLVGDYLKREANDSVVQERLKTLMAELDTKKRQPVAPAGATQQAERPRSEGLALLDKGDLEAAELQLERELRARPDDAELIGGMGLVRLRQGHHAQAQAYFQQARRTEPEQADKWQSLINTARFWGLLREAADARSAREYVLAEDKLREAIGVDAREPQALIALARVQSDRQRMDAAEASYRAALKLDPVSRNALGELLELMARGGRSTEARQMMAALTPAQRTVLGRDLDALEAGMLRGEADVLVTASRLDDALALLETALRLDPDNVWLRYDLGRIHVARKEPTRGFALFDDTLARNPNDPASRYALALLQSSAGQELEALLTLEYVDKALRDGKLTRFQRELWVGLQLQQVRVALGISRNEQARRLLEEAEEAMGSEVDMMPRLARGWADAGDYRRALTLFDRMRAVAPLSAEAGLAEAETLAAAGQIDTLRERMAASPSLAEQPSLLRALLRVEIRRGQHAAAEELLRRLLVLQPEQDDIRVELADFLLAQDRRSEAANEIAALLARSADNARLLLLAGRLAQLEGREDEAISLLQRGHALEQAENRQRSGIPLSSLQLPVMTVDMPVDLEIAGPATPSVAAEKVGSNYGFKQLAGMIDARASWFSAGFDQRERVGTAGYSQYLSKEVAAEAVLPLENGDRWLVRSDVVRLDSGRLDPRKTSDVESFGSMALCVNTPAGCTPARRQTAEGVGLAVGWQRKDLKVDLGSTPLDFSVPNWVGGIADKGDLGEFSWSAELSRRALSGSLLSWAGTKDPNTGRTWGGVVATGLRLGLSHDKGGALGFWSALGLHSLTGRNVQDNQRLQLMAGGYWRIVNQDNHLLSLGLTGMNWHFDKNVGEYSFGHGGYYSPAAYQSLAMPITWAQRFARFSYVVRAAVTVSQDKTDSAPYYPTDAGLQALAAIRGIGARYTASPDNAPSTRGWSFHMGWEYQLEPQLFLGGRVEIERSGAYAPDRYLLFLRYNLDRPAAQPVRLPPEPFIPYSQL